MATYWHIIGEAPDELSPVFDVKASYFMHDASEMRELGELSDASVRPSRNTGVVLMQMREPSWRAVSNVLGGTEILNHAEIRRISKQEKELASGVERKRKREAEEASP